MITYIASASNPADNGLTNTSPVAVVPPGGMQAGDLVLMYAENREITANITSILISNTGGQAWKTVGAYGGTASLPPRIVIFAALFNGTWTANPSVAFVTVTPVNSVVMHVFRPSPGNKFIIDIPLTDTTYNATSPPYTSTITGITTKSSAVAIAAWGTGADITFGTLAGTGWVVTGGAQYRNLAGSDQSMSFAHKIHTTGGATGNVSKNASGTGGGIHSILSFAEISSRSFKAKVIM